MPLYMLGWTGDNGDPDNFLCYFFCSPGASREGFYANQPLADVLLRAQKLTNQSERAKLYRQAEQMLHDDVGAAVHRQQPAAAGLLEEGEGLRARTRPARSTSTPSRCSSARRSGGEEGAVTGYAIRRGLTVIPVLVGVSLLVFSFVHLIPGDPALTMLGERATPEKVTEVRARLGLDRPLWEQYLLYVGKVVHGDLGVSIVRGDPVATDPGDAFPPPSSWPAAAIVLATVIGVPLGMRVRGAAQLADRQPGPGGRAHRRLDADLLAGPGAGVGLRRAARTGCRRASGWTASRPSSRSRTSSSSTRCFSATGRCWATRSAT